MRLRTFLCAGCLVAVVHCGKDETPPNDGGKSGGSGEGGEAGEGTSGSSGTQGGSAGSARGGTSGGASGASGSSSGGSAGEPGSAGEGGSSGEGGAAGEGAAAGESGAGGMAASSGTGGSSGCGATAGTGGQDDGPDAVSGLVRFGHGVPASCAVVAIGSARTNTDANGFFRIPNVAREYDVLTIVENQVLVVRGVLARSLILVSSGGNLDRSATVTGVVTGVSPADRWVRVAFGGTYGSWSFPESVESDSSYSLDVNWDGEESVVGSLYAIAYETGMTGHPTVYNGFGSRPIALLDTVIHGPSALTSIAVSPVGARTVSGTLTVPAGHTADVVFNVGPFATDILGGVTGPFSSLVPTGITAVPTHVMARSERLLAEGRDSSFAEYLIRDSTTTLPASLPVPATLQLPAEDATGVGYDTDFTWDAAPGSVSLWNSAIGGWSIRVVTTGTTTRMPDLRPYGIALIPGSREEWSIASVVGVDSVEQWMELEGDYDIYLRNKGHYGRANTAPRDYYLVQ